MVKEEDLVVMGRVTKPHGVRGETCVLSHAESPEVFGRLGSVLLRKGKGRPRRAVVESWREHGRVLVIRIKGVDDRDGAEALRGCDILARKSDLPPLGRGEVYVHQLAGLKVRLEDGSDLGVLDRVDFPAGREMWTIITPDGKEVLFPVVPEFVAELDTDQGLAVICPPPGLIDLYLGSRNGREKPDDGPDDGPREEQDQGRGPAQDGDDSRNPA